MKKLTVLMALAWSMPAFAASPWLNKLSTCNSALGNQKTGVLHLSKPLLSFEHKRKEIAKHFGQDATAFVGSHSGKGGLWIITGGKAYFADLESIRQKPGVTGKPAWDLQLQIKGKPPLNIEFGYFKNDRIKKSEFTLHTANIGKSESGESDSVTASEYLTTELKEQLETKVAKVLLRILKYNEPPKTPINPLVQLIQNDDAIGKWLKENEDLNKRLFNESQQLDDLKESGEIDPTVRRLRRESQLKDLIACEKALGSSREFSNLVALVKLAKKYIQQQIDPPPFDTPGALEAETNT